uniref:MORN repeat-containing protein 5 n=1 Tax=Cuerna arida TaxID=1464854 RepID=A0A1B6EN50_9HEMI
MVSRKNTVAVDSPGTDSIEIKNTGLRPSWDVFWDVEMEGLMKETTLLPHGTKSTVSGKSGRSGKHVQFVTGSSWLGEWDKVGMCGAGVYKMPHGVTYEGTINAGLFEGIGVLKYPNGGVLEGFWYRGELKYYQYDYADGLKRDSVLTWPYCKAPERRFYSEILQGLRAGDTEQLTHIYPPRPIPPGHYDVGDGFYSPKTKCVIDANTGDVLRIPTTVEEKWIMENCRTADTETVGYCPNLYENWFQNFPQDTSTLVYSEEEKEILDLILQVGRELEIGTTESSRRGTFWSIMSKQESIQELGSASSAVTTTEFEVFLRKIVKVLEESKQKLSLKEDTDEVSPSKQPREEGTEDLVKMLSEITSRYTEKERISSEVKLIPKPSSKSVKKSLTQIFSSLSSLTVPNSTAEMYKSISQQMNAMAKKELPTDASQFMGSQVHYRIDYTEYDTTLASNADDTNTKYDSKS